MTTNVYKTTGLLYEHDNRHKELEEFDKTKLGVKGLVDSGITRIPCFFHHPPENVFDFKQVIRDDDQDLIPVIDMSRPHQELVEWVRDASANLGFFQVVNHGVPVSLIDSLLDAVKAFHELPAEERMQHYGRDVSASCKYLCNVDLFRSKAASWRDTLHIQFGPNYPDPHVIPSVCRDEAIEWDGALKQLGEQLLGLFSEGLGVDAHRLKGLSFLEGRFMAGHYYPYCPEPDKTLGISSHTDSGVFTVLLQDQVGGLQVKRDGKWVDVKPIHGALVINVADWLQMISNDKYISVEHRVFANPSQQPRVSIAVFFSPGIRDNFYGPLAELVSPEEPALYRQSTYSEFLKRFCSKELDGKSLIKYFRLQNM